MVIQRILIIMEMDFKTKKKTIYLPLKKIIKEIMKGLKALDLNIPLAQIARMEIAGKYDDESLSAFRKTVIDYLQTVNKYRYAYFEMMKKTETIFDREMTKDGSFAPGLKQYDSLKTQFFEAILKSDGKAWIMSYNQYLPTIREHASKRSKKPRSGKKMYADVKLIFKKDLKQIKDMRKLSFQLSKLFLKDINFALKNPEMEWQEWLLDDEMH